MYGKAVEPNKWKSNLVISKTLIYKFAKKIYTETRAKSKKGGQQQTVNKTT